MKEFNEDYFGKYFIESYVADYTYRDDDLLDIYIDFNGSEVVINTVFNTYEKQYSYKII
jgi:hypothetical protein